MSGRIPPEFIDELLARTDIVDVIGTRIQIRKAGKDFEARCPFHEERTPSFTVSPSKQFYHCFGCGANGSAIGFLMEYDRLSFREAIDELARRAGLTVPVEGGVAASGPDHAPLHALLARAPTPIVSCSGSIPRPPRRSNISRGVDSRARSRHVSVSVSPRRLAIPS